MIKIGKEAKTMFFKKLIVFILILFSLKIEAQSVFEVYDNKLFNQSNFESPVLLFFSSRRCGICNTMKNEIFKDSSLSQFLQKNFTCYEVETEKNHSDLISKFDVSFIPAYIFLNKKKELIYKTSGYFEAEDFLDKANFVLKKISGKVTDYDELSACIDADDEDCGLLLNKFYETGEWRANPRNAFLAYRFAIINYKNAWKHFQENRAMYYNLIKKEKLEYELYILVLREAEDLLENAKLKGVEPDWNKIDKIFKKYYETAYEKDFFQLKSQHAFKLKNWDSFFSNKMRSIEFELSKTEKSKKSKLLYDRFTNLEELSLSFKLTENQEKILVEKFYDMLIEAEKYSIKPDYKIFEALEVICLELEKNEEAEKYNILLNELKNKSEKKEKQKDSDD